MTRNAPKLKELSIENIYTIHLCKKGIVIYEEIAKNGLLISI